jgi:mannose-6-phosphate isomerase
LGRKASDTTGECWGISAHSHGPSLVKNGKLRGWKLDRVWNEHREVFGNIKGEEYPLLVKLLDAQNDLSVQVHPNDTYAKENEKSPVW